MKSISDSFAANYLTKFRVFKDSIEDPDWKMLRDKRCPSCSGKLKFGTFKEVVYCKSKKHKPFMLTLKRYNQIINGQFS